MTTDGSAATVCHCLDYDPICACSGCGMPIDDCDEREHETGSLCCPHCHHAAKTGVPHAVHI